jgi:hypothetical protein
MISRSRTSLSALLISTRTSAILHFGQYLCVCVSTCSGICAFGDDTSTQHHSKKRAAPPRRVELRTQSVGVGAHTHAGSAAVPLLLALLAVASISSLLQELLLKINSTKFYIIFNHLPKFYIIPYRNPYLSALCTAPVLCKLTTACIRRHCDSTDTVADTDIDIDT